MKVFFVGLIYYHPENSISDFTKQFSEHLLMNNILQNRDVCILGDITFIHFKMIKKHQLKTILLKFSFNLINLIISKLELLIKDIWKKPMSFTN